MRWDSLFDDLEGQLEHELHSEDVDLLAEEERLRLARLSVRDRLVALSCDRIPDLLHLGLANGSTIAIVVGSIGRDWIAGELSDAGRERLSAIIPIDAIASILPTADQLARSVRPDGSTETGRALSARLGLGFVMRDLCRRRAEIDLVTRGPRLHGTIDRVGRDHLDLAEHEPDVPRRSSAVQRIRIVPVGELVTIRF